MHQLVLVAGGAVAFALVLIAIIVTRMIYICPPNEVLIFSGGHRAVSATDQRQVGSRVVQGGRGVRLPVLERVDSMNLTNMPIEPR